MSPSAIAKVVNANAMSLLPHTLPIGATPLLTVVLSDRLSQSAAMVANNLRPWIVAGVILQVLFVDELTSSNLRGRTRIGVVVFNSPELSSEALLAFHNSLITCAVQCETEPRNLIINELGDHYAA